MTTKDQSEDEAAILTVWNDLTMNMCSGCERALYQTLVDNMRAALTAARQDERRKVLEEIAADMDASADRVAKYQGEPFRGEWIAEQLRIKATAIRALAPNPEESK